MVFVFGSYDILIVKWNEYWISCQVDNRTLININAYIQIVTLKTEKNVRHVIVIQIFTR